MPVDRLYQGTEPIAHPLTGELIELTDRDALFRAWTDGEAEIRWHQNELRNASSAIRKIREKCDRIVYALAGQDVTRGAARDFARDEIDQGF